MSLTLHFHPLSSFCWKVLMALYENDTPFTPNLVNLGDAAERAALLKLWPIGKFPVLRDDAQDRTIAESSIIIEYLDNQYPGRARFIPADPKAAPTPSPSTKPEPAATAPETPSASPSTTSPPIPSAKRTPRIPWAEATTRSPNPEPIR